MGIEIRALTQKQVKDREKEIKRGYVHGFQMPASAGTAFFFLLESLFSRPNFQFRAAIDNDRNSLIGYAFGYNGKPGQPWHDLLAQNFGNGPTAKWLKDYFDLVDLVVLPEYRRQGTGSNLLESILGGADTNFSILTLRKNNELAQQFFSKRGWEILLPALHTFSGKGPFSVLGKQKS